MSQHDDETLRRIQDKATRDPCFTDDERATIREVIRVYKGWRFFGKIVRGAVVGVGAVAAAAAAVLKLWQGGG